PPCHGAALRRLGPRFRGDDNGKVRTILFTIKKYANSEILLDFTCSAIMLPPIPIQVSRGAFRRRSVGGGRGRHPRAKDLRNLRPRAVLGQPRRPLGAGPVRPPSKA